MHVNHQNIILDILLGIGIAGSTTLEILRDTNKYINEFGYAVVVTSTFVLAIFKCIDFIHRFKDRKKNKIKK